MLGSCLLPVACCLLPLASCLLPLASCLLTKRNEKRAVALPWPQAPGLPTLVTVTDQLAAVEDRLIDAMAQAARGPKRNGLFALWLFVRLAAGQLSPDELSERAHRRRLESFERRLSSLSLPAPLRRALAGSIRELRDSRRDAVAVALHYLVAPAGEAVGPVTADALDLATRVALAIGERTETVEVGHGVEVGT